MQGDLDFNEPARPLESPRRAGVSVPKRRKPFPPMPVLPGLGIERLDNLFFAIQPPDAAREAINDLARKVCRDRNLAGDLLAAKDYHITIHGLGVYEGVPGLVCEKACAAAERLRMQPFDVCFDSMMSFVRHDPRRALVLRSADPGESLRAFHYSLGERMRGTGLHRCVRSSFTPHVTMGYFRETLVQQPIPPIRWTAERFVLIHSPWGQGIRPDLERHSVLHEWMLGRD